MNKSVQNIYLSIHDSPRSSYLPKSEGLYRQHLKNGDSIKRLLSLKKLRAIFCEMRNINISRKTVWVEYDGNIVLNFLIIINLVYRSNVIILDCHNGSIEREKGKFLKYIINYFYLRFLSFLKIVNIVVHNQTIAKTFKVCKVVHTPYPVFKETKKKIKKEIDFLFVCSLNSDEPLGYILTFCESCENKGYVSRITGNFSKVRKKINERQRKYFYPTFLSYNEYIDELQKARYALCLTTRRDTLLFSPRECLSLNIPVIVSKSDTNYQFYGDSVTYIKNESLLELLEKKIY